MIIKQIKKLWNKNAIGLIQQDSINKILCREAFSLSVFCEKINKFSFIHLVCYDIIVKEIN